jgi:hypothetical protein
MLYDELRRNGNGAAVDAALRIHEEVEEGVDTAVRVAPVVGDMISVIEIATGENAVRAGETVSDEQRLFDAAAMGLPGILEVGGGILKRILRQSDDIPPLGTYFTGGRAATSSGRTEIETLLQSLPKGKHRGIRTVADQAELEIIWRDIRNGGRTVAHPSYPGSLIELPDGTLVGGRPHSTSGGPTIDIKFPDGTIRTIHVRKW